MLRKVNQNISCLTVTNQFEKTGAQDHFLPVSLHENINLKILATCDELQLPKDVKYKARHILDLCVQRCYDALIHDQDQIASVCIAIVLELDNHSESHINQQAQSFIQQIIVDDGSDYLVQSIKNAISQKNCSDKQPDFQQFISTEKTPYHYLCGLNSDQFPKFKIQVFRDGVENMIDLALTIPQIGNCSCLEVFSAVLQAFLELKGYLRDSIPQKWLLQTQGCFQLKGYLLQMMEQVQL